MIPHGSPSSDKNKFLNNQLPAKIRYFTIS
uniref:Uncharacterized protein n=1 Tax=Siphoviridae sp. ctdYc1 TaxID=2826399 RepID=A0A8S5N0G7_9CAUD|nr:MAG TPA: hypothetical protein [Siphoviridae sp. ctdYc1]